jgi:hypothetical protein
VPGIDLGAAVQLHQVIELLFRAAGSAQKCS